MRDAPGEHGADAQTPGNGRRVTLLLFEAEDGVASLHLDAGQLRQAVDQAVGQSVGQIFRFRVDIFAGAIVDEGQHGQRVNRPRPDRMPGWVEVFPSTVTSSEAWVLAPGRVASVIKIASFQTLGQAL